MVPFHMLLFVLRIAELYTHCVPLRTCAFGYITEITAG